MISQDDAKQTILRVWDTYKKPWSDHSDFKSQKMLFTLELRDNHKELLEFRCKANDPSGAMKDQIIEGWINKHEGYPNC